MTGASSQNSAPPRIGRLRTSNYDISNSCNLRCEGCLYFSAAGDEIARAETDIAVWRRFFAAEAQRGINFAYLGGAEPSLTPDRIHACQDHIAMGAIFTNGTKRIASDIRYRIHVSLWGSDDQASLYRGANVNRKALRNYEGDARAVFVMTLNALNLHEAQDVARACRDHGVTLTFSLFSPPVDYAANMRDETRSDYFRFSAPHRDLRFTDETLAAARDVMFQAAADYPETVRIAPDFINWVTQPGSLYALDANGVAANCGNRLTRKHIHYNADLTRNEGKCCSPNLDCSACRPYAMSLATFFTRRREISGDWESVWRFWVDCFMPLEASGIEARAPEARSEIVTA